MPKKGLMGCSLPLAIGLVAVVLILLLIGLVIGPIGKSILATFAPNVSLPSWLSVPQPEPKLPAEAVFHVRGERNESKVIAA